VARPFTGGVSSLVPGLLTPPSQGEAGKYASVKREVICFLKSPILILCEIRVENSPQMVTPVFFKKEEAIFILVIGIRNCWAFLVWYP
jgi:hypothetical protein